MLPPERRVVTGHEKGKSKVLINDQLEPTQGFAAAAATIWQNHQYPAELSDHDASLGKTLVYNKGSLIRVVDFPANSQGHNHRTKSIDYGIVMDGEIELALEDGSKTIVKAGDIVVQQATLHQWNNASDKPCRMIFVLIPSKAPQGPDGTDLEDLGIPENIKAEA